jgi:hypothetical protein
MLREARRLTMPDDRPQEADRSETSQEAENAAAQRAENHH